ncbi:MAG: universal stress protein [Calditrichaeota bacterium]|nr:MAG: universal stress protein [Calditrichota bacterium]
MLISRILVPMDFSPASQGLLAHALHIAGRFSAHITLYHVVSVFDDDPYNPKQEFPEIPEYYQHLEQRADEELEKVLAQYPHEGVSVSRVICRGFSPAEEILSFAAEHDIDLIIMGTHGRKAIAHLLLGSVAEKVVHYASCPVLTAHVRSDGSVPASPYNHVLVPIDFSEQSQRALQFAADFVAENGEIDLLHVVEDTIHPAYYSSEGETIFELMPNLREKSLSMLSTIAEQLQEKIPQKVTTTVLEGSIYQEIAAFAQTRGINLIIMGTHGMNAISRLLIGSQASRVIRNAACPVITLK